MKNIIRHMKESKFKRISVVLTSSLSVILSGSLIFSSGLISASEMDSEWSEEMEFYEPNYYEGQEDEFFQTEDAYDFVEETDAYFEEDWEDQYADEFTDETDLYSKEELIETEEDEIAEGFINSNDELSFEDSEWINEMPEIHNPVITANGSMNSKVEYSCVWFGMYPQAEVVASANSYSALPFSSISEEDLIVDSELFAELENGNNWNGNNININGENYYRIRMNDATYAVENTAGYYNWEDGNAYHYFKYEPIKWRVLSVDNESALLLSDQILDNQSWEECMLHGWLNRGYNKSGFVKYGFSEKEQQSIIDKDGEKVSFLSESEVYGHMGSKYGFSESADVCDEARACRASAFAKAMGVYFSVEESQDSNSWWWLKNTQDDSMYAVNVAINGCANNYSSVGSNIIGVRPALILNLSSDLYMYAGTVCTSK